MVVIPIDFECIMFYGLNDIHIDLTLDSLKNQYPHVKILILGLQAHSQIGTNGYQFTFENTANLIISYHNHWVTATNINTGRSSVQISTVNTPVIFMIASMTYRI